MGRGRDADHDRTSRHRLRKSFAIDPDAAGILVDLAAMKAAVADPNIVKLDTRDVDEWIADSSSPYGKDYCPAQRPHPRRGLDRVVPDDEAVGGRPMFKSRGGILAECATVGVTRKRRSCSIASRARPLRIRWSL